MALSKTLLAVLLILFALAVVLIIAWTFWGITIPSLDVLLERLKIYAGRIFNTTALLEWQD